MSVDDVERELAALRTRASTAEAARQSARQAGDWPRHASLELELQRLARRAVELERQRTRVA